MNKVILMGNVGKDAELTVIPSGNKVAKFAMATSESFKDKSGNKVTNTEWHNIVVWGTLAEIAEKYVKKGRQVLVEGKVVTKSWDDATTNTKRYATEILASSVQLLGKKDGTDSSEGSEYSQEEQAPVAPAATAPAAKPAAKATTAAPAAKQAYRAPAVVAPADDTDDLPF